MTRAAALALVAALAGCSGWPDLDPVDGNGELDPRLGTELARSVHVFRIGSVFTDAGLEVVFEETGASWHAVLVDPDTLDVTALPAPPLEPGETFVLGRALSPLRGALAVERGPDVTVAVLDGSWRELPTPPIDATSAGEITALLAHDDAVYLVIGTTVLVWNGSAWLQPVSTASPVMLGGFDATTQWLVAAEGAWPLHPDGTAGAQVPGALGAITPHAINGDADRFQLVAGGALWTFDGATFTAGDAAPGGPWSAPGSPRILLSTPSGVGTQWTFAEDGRAGATALAPFQAVITCACDPAVDPACGCAPHAVDYVDARPSPDTATMGLTMADVVDGYAVLTARFLPLPYDGDPFAGP